MKDLERFIEIQAEFFRGLGPWQYDLILILLLVINILFVIALVRWVFTPLLTRLTQYTPIGLDDHFFKKYASLFMKGFPLALVIDIFSGFMRTVSGNIFDKLGEIVMIVTVVVILLRLTDDLHHLLRKIGIFEHLHTRGLAQAVKLILSFIGGIFIISSIIDQTPWRLLGGLGAITAILLLIFRDAILGLVAGLQVSLNRMVAIGDWIELPERSIDGDVLDIALTTIKIENFDKSITYLPTYTLISSSFKNWRRIQDIGVRRIKRQIFIHMDSIRFLDENEVGIYKSIPRLKEFFISLEEKPSYVVYEDPTFTTETQKEYVYTTMGLYRLYTIQYLFSHPRIRNDLTLLVRTMKPSPKGVGLELYCFTDTANWLEYEAIQSRVVEHLLAVAKHFDLKIFQDPSGLDMQQIYRSQNQPTSE